MFIHTKVYNNKWSYDEWKDAGELDLAVANGTRDEIHDGLMSFVQ